MKLRLFLLGYSLLWHLLLPLILLYLWHRGRKDRRYRQHLGERFGHYPLPVQDCIWVHGVSLGETRSAVPLIRAMLDRGDRIVTTHFTPTGRREAESVFAADIAAGQLRAVWVPFETTWAYRRFFRAFTPRFGLVMEIEIWPRMIFAAKRAKIPLFMCNAQYPSKSLARDSARFPLRQALMRGFAGALVKSDLQATRFASVGVRNIAVTGELRFDQPIPPALLTAGIAARHWLGATHRRVITIASAVEGEDATYLSAIRALQAHHRAQNLTAPLFIYVPRRPERFDSVNDTLTQAGLHVLRRSTTFGTGLDPATGSATGLAAPATPDILLGDSLGEMYFYLAMADQVIVGGGFNPKGAHNIIEPLALRKPVLTGPHIDTIEYPMTEALAAGVAQSVADAAALAAALIANHPVTDAQIDAFFDAHAGATARTLAALPDLLTT